MLPNVVAQSGRGNTQTPLGQPGLLTHLSFLSGEGEQLLTI